MGLGSVSWWGSVVVWVGGLRWSVAGCAFGFGVGGLGLGGRGLCWKVWGWWVGVGQACVSVWAWWVGVGRAWFGLAGMARVGWGKSVVIWASELVGWGWSVVVSA